MGKVRVSEFHHIAGIYEPVESIVDYTYCDKCGSFNIDIAYPKRPLDDALAIVVPISFVAALATGLFTHSLAVCGGIGIIGLGAFLVYMYGKRIRCMTCGNERISSDNVLHLSGDNLGIDVPDEAIVKDFVKTLI